MFTVKTNLEKSPINGLGCMAAENIPKGTIIWKFQENFDVILDDKQFNELPKIAQDFIFHFGYYNKKEGGYILCMDNAKYTNHSFDPNMKMIDNIQSIAIKDIKEGEEITEDYFGFDELATMKLGSIKL
jgi:SET domain-containing protein